MDQIETFIRGGCEDILGIARQTVERFGEAKAEQFLVAAADGITIQFAIMGCYEQPDLMNLVNAQAWGMVKELKWLQLLFLAGNYPLVKSRLRYIWEAVFRAYFAEAHNDPDIRSLGPDAKLRWLEGHQPRLEWTNCVAVVLKWLLPVADKAGQVFDRYRDLWRELNRYVHPSAYVQTRMVDESALLVTDNFDPAWAEGTLLAGRMVVDLVWLALLSFYQKAIPAVAGENLHVEYPLTALLLRKRTQDPPDGAGHGVL